MTQIAEQPTIAPPMAPAGVIPPKEGQDSGPDWKTLYGGLDGLDDRVSAPQKAAFSLLDKTTSEPKEARARAINQTYLEKQMPGLDPHFIENNWDAVKSEYAKQTFGLDQEKIPDTALYSKIGEQFKPQEGGKDGKGDPWTFLGVHIAPDVGYRDLEKTKVGQAIANWHEKIGQVPLAELPDAPVDKLPNIPIPTVLGPAITLKQAGMMWNLLKPQIEGMESPEGLATLAVGGALEAGAAKGIPAAVKSLKTMSGVFAVVMAKAAEDGAKEIKRVQDDPNHTPMDVARAYASEAANVFGSLVGAFHSLHAVTPEVAKATEGKPITEAPATIADAAAKIADPEKQQIVVEAANKVAEATGQPKVEVPKNDDTYGIAARVTEQRAEAGKVEAIDPGEGIAAEDSVKRGRQLLREGGSPEEAVARFEKTKAVNADDLALARAHGEELAKAASKAADKYGIDSDEYRAAAKADSDWLKRIKPMQTEWHRSGMAMQGETELDTGDFHSLRREFNETAGRDFTPAEANKANQIATGVKEAEGDVEAAKEKTLTELSKEPKTQDEKTADIWKRAKKYLDAGEDDFDDIRHKIAQDTGLPVEEVTKRLAGPKRMRVVTNDMYSKMARRRALIDQAKYWIKKQAEPRWERFIKAVPRAFFAMKVAGHGTVGMITHAGINVFNPAEWAIYWPHFAKQFSLVASRATHEQALQDLAREPNYVTARRAGLANSASKAMDDYQKGFRGWFGQMGNRGFDALKIYRQARFSQAWEKLPQSMQTPEYAKMLADSINHSTGYVKANIPTALSIPFFAPRLEASRWAYIWGDSFKAAKTFAGWEKATPEQQAFASMHVKRLAITAGTYAAFLAANDGLLKASGSKQKLNWNDPKKPDWLAFKVGGFNVSIISPMLTEVRLLGNLLHAAVGIRHGSELKDSRRAEQDHYLALYAEGKLSPFGQFVNEVRGQSDWRGRPLPFSDDKVPSYLKREGVGKESYAEWVATQALPIPLEDAIKEVWAEQGMSDARIQAYTKGLIVGAVAGLSGVRMDKDTESGQTAKKPKANRNTSHTNQ